jgi:hypothetical protein
MFCFVERLDSLQARQPDRAPVIPDPEETVPGVLIKVAHLAEASEHCFNRRIDLARFSFSHQKSFSPRIPKAVTNNLDRDAYSFAGSTTTDQNTDQGS